MPNKRPGSTMRYQVGALNSRVQYNEWCVLDRYQQSSRISPNHIIQIRLESNNVPDHRISEPLHCVDDFIFSFKICKSWGKCRSKYTIAIFRCESNYSNNSQSLDSETTFTHESVDNSTKRPDIKTDRTSQHEGQKI